jgi:transcriptional regulator with XRE-family HTH domain
VQCRMARAAIGLSARKLAAAAKVSPETVIRFERGERLRKRTIDSLRQVLEAAGLEFTDGRKPGVRLASGSWQLPLDTLIAYALARTPRLSVESASRRLFALRV